VFHEVAQKNAYYFSGKTASELADSVSDWLKLNLKGETPMSVNLQWKTWRQAAKKISSLLTVKNIKQKAMDEHLNLIHAARVKMVKTLLPQGDFILDLGGANCPLYKMEYPYHFKKLTLIDLPPDQRHDYYKDIVIDSNCSLGTVVVRYTDMTTLEGIADESVDFVWSGQSIEHVPLEGGERMCREAFRVLKKGGVFCLDTPNRWLTEIHTATIGGGFIHPEHYIEYYPEQLIQIIKKAGFIIKNSYGICQMPETISTGEFHYEDFIFGEPITDKVNDGYIQFLHCIKN
jgi:SAM-dependent methyltransferase